MNRINPSLLSPQMRSKLAALLSQQQPDAAQAASLDAAIQQPQQTPQPQRLTASVMPGSDRGVMKEPHGGGWANALGTVGATLQDTGMALNGGQGNALGNLQATRDMQRREMEALREQRIGDKGMGSLMSGLAGGGDVRSMLSDPRVFAAITRDPQRASALFEMFNQSAPEPLVTRPGDILRDADDPTRIIAQNEVEAKPPETRTRNLPNGYAVDEMWNGSDFVPTGPQYPRWQPHAPTSGAGPARVQSADILPNGTNISVFTDGRTQVTSPTGEILTGEAAAQAIQDAQEYGVRIAGQGAGARGAGGAASRQAEQAFTKLQNVNSTMYNLVEAKRLIGEGANTGRLDELVPDWNASTIELRNTAALLGLDIVGATTFGALSESELQFALGAALPTNLDGPDLVNWIDRKIAAQQKLAQHLNDAAIYLSTPGNTIGTFLQSLNPQAPQATGAAPAGAAPVGWSIRVKQ